MSSTGFVTFNDMASVVAAAKSPLSHNPDVLRVSIAPDPRDIIWENAHINLSYCKGREWTVSYLSLYHPIFEILNLSSFGSFNKLGEHNLWIWCNSLVYSGCEYPGMGHNRSHLNCTRISLDGCFEREPKVFKLC